MTSALTVKNAAKSFGNTAAVQNVSFSVESGSVTGLLGPNGAGKTTLIRMITGLVRPDSGSIFIYDSKVTGSSPEGRKKIGAVVENPEMYSYLSGWKNLLHFSRLHSGVDKKRIQEVTELVGLSGRIHEKAGTYSLGMRQRLGLAQALLHRPSLLILDEPTNGLDPAGIREIRTYLRKLAHEENLAVLVSSHLLSEMELLCDELLVIQQGSLTHTGSMSLFLEQEENSMYLETEPSPTLPSVLEHYMETDVIKKENGWVFTCRKEQVPDLLQHLVDHGVRVTEIRPSRSTTLEEKFLTVTEGGGLT
ncbi:ABC transporter ATP-binding protein [Alkalicoccus urumqiensis]|uniref:Bacitracin ABC transporter ATP-binding protein n=1 Tax=Alkalicoccus urumqiensis TaxID=1548213 RepID=A0A2P6MGG0_ALKUR|nr:ABC transporter ATP-binding protein [Alkalicoccus urumqiensis]PRO65369.1 bacitracin ABC transporter ATP-binding protein [Alkalicoccus urumqiensis]